MVYVIVFMSNQNFAVPQLLLTLVVNPSNIFIAKNLVPLPKIGFLNLTIIAKISDFLAIIIIYNQLMMSDIGNPTP